MTEVLDADIHGYPTLAAMPITAILLTFKEQTAAIDVSAAVSVQDVISTILSVFHLQASTRIILRRTRDGAIAVPGPKLSPGEYTVEAIETPNQAAYRNLREKHLPQAHKDLTEKHLPYLVNAGKTAGAHLSKAAESLGSQVGRGYEVAGAHAQKHYNTASTAVKGHLKHSASVLNDHHGTNSHTWTANLWSHICTCAPGPISFITGVPVEELPIKKNPEIIATTPTPTGTVPLSNNGGVVS